MSRTLELALRAWPREYRQAHGDELVDTARELGGGHATVREVAGLATGGMRARFRAAIDGSRAGVWSSGAALGLLLSLGSHLAQFSTAFFAGPSGDLAETWWWPLAVLGVSASGIALVALCTQRPMAGAASLTSLGLMTLAWGPQTEMAPLTVFVVAHLVLVWLLAITRHRVDWRVAARTTTAVGVSVGVGLVIANFWIGHTGLLLTASVIAVAASPFDPRLLAGMCCFWSIGLATGLAAAMTDSGGVPDPLVLAIPGAIIAAGAGLVARTNRVRPI